MKSAVILGSLAVCLLGFVAPELKGVQIPEKFKEESGLRGINYGVEQGGTFGCGLAFVDLDNDQDPDLVTLGKLNGGLPATTLGLYENDGNGFFTDRALGSGIPEAAAAAGISAGDFDGDGDLDLYITLWLEPNLLLRNDGDFSFTDIAGTPGFESLADDGAGSGSCWGDYDNDGWLDLYVTNRTTTNHPEPPFDPSNNPNLLFHNLGGTGFEEVALAMGVESNKDPSFCASFLDFDRDGDADLYLSNDKGLSTACTYRNRLWENVGGSFVDISAASGTDGCIDAMCVAMGDFDGNRLQDIYVSNLPAGNPLYLNQGGAVFSEESVAYGVASFQIGWGSVFFDYDNDTWLDLYVCQHRSFEPNHLYDFNGIPPAVDVAADMDVDDTGESFVCAVADIDDDGDLDLAVSNRGGEVRLYVNFVGELKSFAKFRVVGEGNNHFGVGANVEVLANGRWLLREVVAGSAFKSQDDLVVHVGLDDATVMTQIDVDWPGGTSRSLFNYQVDKTWTLYPPSDLGDGDLNGVVNLADFNLLVDCFGQAVTPGCEIMDMNGDAQIDLLDVPAFLAVYVDPQVDCNTNGTVDLIDILLADSRDDNRNGVPDECETFFLSPPTPGIHGTVNTFAVRNGTPNQNVLYLYSRQLGSTAIPGCPGLNSALSGPVVFGNLATDGNGSADFDVFVPNKADNRTFRFEALQPGSCIITDLVTYSFP